MEKFDLIQRAICTQAVSRYSGHSSRTTTRRSFSAGLSVQAPPAGVKFQIPGVLRLCGWETAPPSW